MYVVDARLACPLTRGVPDDCAEAWRRVFAFRRNKLSALRAYAGRGVCRSSCLAPFCTQERCFVSEVLCKPARYAITDMGEQVGAPHSYTCMHASAESERERGEERERESPLPPT
jgi:hypothetical protein